MSKHIHIGDEGPALAGVVDPSSRRPAGETREPVILAHHRPPTAASVGPGDAIEPEGESFSSLGSIAVRLVARFTLPRMSLAPTSEERGEGRGQPPVRSREEDR